MRRTEQKRLIPSPDPGGGFATLGPMGDDQLPADLVAVAELVLDQNWLGRATKPAPRLYPHQWSWDSAFIAIGNARRAPGRATTELRSLFEGQWSNGLVPHIVFSDSEATAGAEYFPSPADWQSSTCPDGPRSVETSGICQPPVHASAVRMIADRVPTGSSFARDLYEPLTAWHDYLFNHRANGSVLTEVWHPWESGMDNTPAWDGPMAALTLTSDEVPPYRRVDDVIGDPNDRPTDRDYDRYVYIVDRLRRDGYAPDDPGRVPFRVRDVLFNSLLVRSEQDLAALAAEVGADGSHHVERARVLAEAVHSELWSPDLGMHVSCDVNAGRSIDVGIGGAFTALLADPPAAIADRAITTMIDRFLVTPAPDTAVLPTVPVTSDAFEPSRYWRGPTWINIMWLVARGLVDVGRPDLATQLVAGIRWLVATGGFSEYFDPVSGSGHGSQQFSWTAALFLDLADTFSGLTPWSPG